MPRPGAAGEKWSGQSCINLVQITSKDVYETKTMFITILLFIGLACFLSWYILKKDRGEREPASMLWAALGFGLLALVPAALLEALFIPHDIEKLSQLPVPSLFFSAMAVGVIEEVCKFVPLAFFVFKKRYFNEYTDGILYFALAGLGFGLPENILYTLQGGAATGFVRLLMTPFFHAATTAYIGYYLAKAKVTGQGMQRTWVALGAMIVVHGLYDFFLLSGREILVLLGMATSVGLTAILFVMASKAKQDDQRIGLSVVGTNAFCRSCGNPNPKGLLYCQRCGNRA